MNHDREIVGATDDATPPAPNRGPGPPGLDPVVTPLRDPKPMLDRTIHEWGGHEDLWVFGYGSLIWKPDFHFAERRTARVHGWHRALKMWSRINRGTTEVPGLVFGLLSGGSCQGMVFRVPAAQALETLGRLWLREMASAVYDPRWLECVTTHGKVRGLAFTLSRRSPSFTGVLEDDHYRHIFANACGRYGTSLDYAQQTLLELQRHGIHDAALARLVRLAEARLSAQADSDAARGSVQALLESSNASDNPNLPEASQSSQRPKEST